MSKSSYSALPSLLFMLCIQRWDPLAFPSTLSPLPIGTFTLTRSLLYLAHVYWFPIFFSRSVKRVTNQFARNSLLIFIRKIVSNWLLFMMKYVQKVFTFSYAKVGKDSKTLLKRNAKDKKNQHEPIESIVCECNFFFKIANWMKNQTIALMKRGFINEHWTFSWLRVASKRH